MKGKEFINKLLNRGYDESKDPVFTEPIHKEEVAELPAPKKGRIDLPMLLITSLLVVFGCVMIFSASSVYAEQYHNDNTYFIARHLAFLILAVAITFVAVKFCTPKFWRDFTYPIFAIAVLLLMMVPIIGTDLGSGAKRWIDFKVITIQPSEIAKLALVLVLASFFAKYEKKVLSETKFGGSFKYGVLFPGLVIGLLAGLIAIEHHISGLMIIGMLGISIMFLGGTKIKWIAAIGIAVLCAGCLLVLVSDYAKARVETWLFIEQADPLGSAWQTLQGLMAIGSGGLFGTGLGNSRQKFGYVSQPQNDFIFTIVCEELGFVGAFLVIGLFVLFVWRGFQIAKHAPDKFSALVVYGLTFKVALQVILNLAVVTNSMPNTGIALPFFSYGGTSLLLQVFEVGIILSISRYCSHQKI